MAYVTLENILGKDQAELTALKQGEYETEKLGLLPYTAVDHAEYKAAKNSCMRMVPDKSGGRVPELDDDRLMLEIIVTSVDKDQRSNFTFASKALLEKLGVVKATDVVAKLLSPGEVYNLAIKIQDLSGFGLKAELEIKEAVKN